MVSCIRVSSDVLVLGAGGGGLRAAIESQSLGAKTIVVSKSVFGKAHTVMAEGGIAASLGDVDPKDSWEVHFSDTVREGVYIGDWRSAEILSKEAPERVYELEHYGALFDRTPEGKIMQRAFGAHTYRRLCHVGDKTGLEIIQTLKDMVLHLDIEVMDEVFITKIVVSGGRAVGAIGIRMRTGEVIVFSSKAVIVATGGCGRIYKTTSNSWESTGDGIALAFNAGAELKDMEMVQFHPTGMVYPPGVKGLLVTESVRGEGGMLFNSKGERFMRRYSPKRMELDARDVVARAVYAEIMAGRGTKHGGVYLDISYKGAAFIKKKLPGMYEQFKEFAGVDITKEKMEVAPTVHYHMGGISVNPEDCRTTVEGLFAAGEVTSGLHGANRLGGNSLADILVFGRRAGMGAASYSRSREGAASDIEVSAIDAEMGRIAAMFSDSDGSNPYQLVNELRDNMAGNVGIIREEKGLRAALDSINSIKERAQRVRVAGNMVYNHALFGLLELQNMLIVSECVVLGALERKESRGAHTRSDYPSKDRSWKANIVCMNDNGKIALRKDEVRPMPADLLKIVGEEVY